MNFSNIETALHSIFGKSDLGIVVVDKNGKVVEVNQNYSNNYSYKRSELIGKNLHDYIPSEQNQKLSEAFSRLITKEVDHLTIERHILNRDGEDRWYRVHCSIITEAVENEEYFLGVMIDITLQKRQSDQITILNELDLLLLTESRSTEDILQKFFQFIQKILPIKAINLWSIEMDQIPRLVSMALPDNSKELNSSRSLISKLAPAGIESGAKWILKDSLPNHSDDVLLIQICVSGKVVQFIEIQPSNFLRLKDVSMDLFQNIGHRLSSFLEKKELDARLLQSAKLASLGELAGSIAHEINNPLTMVYGRACQIESSLKNDSWDKKNLQEKISQIKIYSERIVNLVTSLKNFSRTGLEEEYAVSSTEKIISESVSIYRDRFDSEGIEIVTDEFQLVNFPCQPVLIQSVLLNLLENAKDSVLSSSMISRRIFVGCLVNAETITFYVRDNGPGVDKKLGQKIFKPFTTSKHLSNGTGLGLSISKDIVEAHKGRIWYESSNKVTTFFFTLPR